ncbi:MAG: hypothetical protein P1U65_08915 [Minwuia sp.]|nr:hypothetical protein [Minwuia sp.]
MNIRMTPVPHGAATGVTALGIAFGLALAPMSAQSAEAAFPSVSGEVGFEVQNDFNFESEDPNAEQNELGMVIEPVINLNLSRNVFVTTGMTLEAVRDPGPQEDRVFQDHGIFVDTLTLNYEQDDFAVYAGKFGPNFSIGYDAAPGIYGSDLLGDDVELAEFIGAGGSLGLGETGLGNLALSGSVFFLDRTFLSESFITNRGRTNLAAGGAGNTEVPESFAIALDGEAVPGMDGLRFHTAFARMGVNNADTEYRATAGADWAIAVDDDLTLTPLAEYVRFWNAGGNGAESRNYMTLSLLAETGPWNVAIAFTGKDVDVDNANGSTFDHQTQISAGYAFANGFTLDVGYKNATAANQTTQTLGALVTYAVAF